MAEEKKKLSRVKKNTTLYRQSAIDKLNKSAKEIVDNTEIIDITELIDKKEKKNFIAYGIYIICLGALLVSGYKILEWKFDNDKINNQIQEINESISIDEVTDNDKTEIIEQNEEEIDKENPYWDYIKMNLINVDFSELKTKNDQTKGWIQVLGTNINYPFVQTDNNSFYLNHGFDKKYNSAGWVFLDYRDKLNLEERNTILYAHGRQDKTMFGSLKNILTSGWLNNTDNYLVSLSTEYENTLWQVFSVYRIPETNDYIVTDFFGNKDFLDFATMLKNRSFHDFNTTVNGNDRILTLSTCYNLTDRVVLHAKLIKREVK